MPKGKGARKNIQQERGESCKKGSEIELTKQLVIDTRRSSQTDKIFHRPSSEGEHIVKFTADY